MSARASAQSAVKIVAWGWTAIVTLALAGITIAWFSGQDLRTVDSASMAPTVPKGSLAVLEPVREADLAVGDVVEFTDPVDASRTVLHRIEEIASPRGSGRYLRTQGDANATPDPLRVPASSVHARLTHSVPHVGALIWALRPPAGFVILTGGPLALFLLSRWTQRRHVVDASHEDSTLPRKDSEAPFPVGQPDEQPNIAG